MPRRIGKVLAGRDGILGVLSENLIDTSYESAASIAALKNTPGGAFGSSRYMPGDFSADRRVYERLVEVFRAHNIRYFLYNGGNGSADTAWRIAHLEREFDYPIVSIAIPKTIDNDIVGTDCCPGYGSAAKYVATSIREASLDLAAMATTDTIKSATRVFMLEVMGRNVGWLAAAAGLAAERPGEAPHILLLPEVPFDQPRFLAHVAATVKRVGHCVIVVSEGIRDGTGRLLSPRLRADPSKFAPLGGIAPGLGKLIGENLGLKYQFAVASYLQRSGRHLASKTDLDQAYAVGAVGVKLALEGRNSTMAVIQRTHERPYRWKVRAADLGPIANVERKVPADFISADGFHITPACRRYLLPLIAGEAPVPFAGGLPATARLRLRQVRKRLQTFDL